QPVPEVPRRRPGPDGSGTRDVLPTGGGLLHRLRRIADPAAAGDGAVPARRTPLPHRTAGRRPHGPVPADRRGVLVLHAPAPDRPVRPPQERSVSRRRGGPVLDPGCALLRGGPHPPRPRLVG